MHSWPRIERMLMARLAPCFMLLCLACGEVPQGADGTLSQHKREPQALLATDLGQWSPTGPLVFARASHTATLLPSGKLLVAGGSGTFSGALSSAEVYDPGRANGAPRALWPRSRRHTATLLPSGKVLVAGALRLPGSLPLQRGGVRPGDGPGAPPARWPPLARATRRRCCPRARCSSLGALAPAAAPSPARRCTTRPRAAGAPPALWPRLATTTRRRCCRRARCSSLGAMASSGSLSSAEVYDPATGQWSTTGSWPIDPRATTTRRRCCPPARCSSRGLAPARRCTTRRRPLEPTASGLRSHHTATLLPSGKVLVAGATPPLPLQRGGVRPGHGHWSPTPLASVPHTATLLPTGKVLVAGAAPASSPARSSTTRPPANGAPRPRLRSLRHTATLLPTGRCSSRGLLRRPRQRGGVRPGHGHWSPRLWPPAPHTATLLPTGKVLVAGGLTPPAATSPARRCTTRPPAHGAPRAPWPPPRAATRRRCCRPARCSSRGL